MTLNSVKVKHIFIFVLIGCLYFAGVSAIIYPMVSNVYSLTTSRNVISDYEKKVEQMPDYEIEQKFKNANQYNTDVAQGIYNDGLEKSLCNEDELICYVDIPSLSIYLPAYYGTSDEVLQKGCGCLENTSLPVGGKSTHSVISAHTGLPSAEMFTKLDQIKKDDVFYIHVLDRVLAYQVDRIEAVTPDKIELLEVVKDMDYCTLLTCTPYGINDKRLLVRGVRIPYNPEIAQATQSANTSNLNAATSDELSEEIKHQLIIITGIILAAVVVYVSALIWLITTIKKSPALQEDRAEESNGEFEKTD